MMVEQTIIDTKTIAINVMRVPIPTEAPSSLFMVKLCLVVFKILSIFVFIIILIYNTKSPDSKLLKFKINSEVDPPPKVINNVDL